MPDESFTLPEPAPDAPEPVRSPTSASLLPWIVGGLRASVLRAPRVVASPSPWQLLLLVLIPNLVSLGIARLQIDGAATFNPLAVLNTLWGIALTLWIGWWALAPGRTSTRVDSDEGGLSRWFALAAWTGLPWTLAMGFMALAYYRGWLPRLLTTSSGFWTVYGLLLAAWFVAMVRLTARYVPTPARLALFAPCLLALTAVGIWQGLQDPDRVWQQDFSASTQPQRPRLQLTQEAFEQQQRVWERSVAQLAPSRAGETNVYGLVFAPYASEDVFLRESTMVARLLEKRFGAEGRVLHLANHATTTDELPWATPLNMRRAIDALAARMDRENDVLVIYMTSHGARDFKLAASHWPLTVPGLTPSELREALDAAGIRHRVIAISACYSGGWIEPLATDDSLVMTAADADHTSYGCGRLSELTFFGRAVFDEQLRTTRSFEAAFTAAVPLIRQREVEAGKDDGFSNPQIRVGPAIRPVLEKLYGRLDNN